MIRLILFSGTPAFDCMSNDVYATFSSIKGIDASSLTCNYTIVLHTQQMIATYQECSFVLNVVLPSTKANSIVVAPSGEFTHCTGIKHRTNS